MKTLSEKIGEFSQERQEKIKRLAEQKRNEMREHDETVDTERIQKPTN